MEKLEQKPYLVKLPPYDLGKAISRVVTGILGISLMGSGAALGALLVLYFGLTGVWAGLVFFIALSLPWLYMILDEIYLRPKRPSWKNSPYTKWCYVPRVKAQIEGQTSGQSKAWIRSDEGGITIDKPGFYFLKPGYHVEFVGTGEEMADYQRRLFNGEI